MSTLKKAEVNHWLPTLLDIYQSYQRWCNSSEAVTSDD